MVNYAFDIFDLYKEKRVNRKDVEYIKEWTELQDDLPDLNFQEVAIFLIACDNDVEMVKKCIPGYFSVRNSTPQVFSGRNTLRKDILEQLEIAKVCILPKRTKNNYAIVMTRLYDSTPSKCHFDICLKYIFMIYDSLLYRNPPNGYIVCLDMTNTTFRHLGRIHLNLMRVSLSYVQDFMPLKVKEVHILNSLWFLSNLLRMMKPFMHKELMSKIHAHRHDQLEYFHENFIPKTLLPEEYGGDLPSFEELHNETLKNLTHLNDHFYEEELERSLIYNQESTD